MLLPGVVRCNSPLGQQLPWELEASQEDGRLAGPQGQADVHLPPATLTQPLAAGPGLRASYDFEQGKSRGLWRRKNISLSF